jgi:hypothetical protein
LRPQNALGSGPAEEFGTRFGRSGPLTLLCISHKKSVNN